MNTTLLTQAKYDGEIMSLEDFLLWESDDDYIYEWVKGKLIAKEAMKNTEIYLVANIQDKFLLTQSFQQGDRLLAETDCRLNDEQTRRPDIVLYSRNQIKASALGEYLIPAFVIEIISENDNMNKVEQKILGYFSAGVQVLWHIFPELKLVKVYNSAKESKTYIEDETFSAKPVVADLGFSVEELFTIK